MSKRGRGTRKVCKYRPTSKDMLIYAAWLRGERIGFTQTSSLKAKGLIPRTSKTQRGKKIISKKYC
jgi:hypothetical protein